MAGLGTDRNKWEISRHSDDFYKLSGGSKDRFTPNEVLPHELMHFIVREHITAPLNLSIEELSSIEEILVLSVQYFDERWVKTLQLQTLKTAANIDQPIYAIGSTNEEIYRKFIRLYFKKFYTYEQIAALTNFFQTCIVFFDVLNHLTIQKQSDRKASQLGWVDMVNSYTFLSKHKIKVSKKVSISMAEINYTTAHLKPDFEKLLQTPILQGYCKKIRSEIEILKQTLNAKSDLPKS